MFLLAKKKSKDKEIAFSSFVPTLVGVSEPAIFAVNLKYSIKPFICACLGAGLGGAFMKLADVRAIGQGLTGVLGLLIVVPEKLPFYIIGNLIAFICPIIFILAYDKFKGISKGEDDDEKTDVSANVLPSADKKPVLRAVVDGKVVPVENIGDGVFSEKTLGGGVGIIPESETVLAPADGTVSTVMEESEHAVGITLSNGAEILIHVGIDTVSMKGDGFECFVKAGDGVRAGQKIITFDKKKIERKGLNPAVVIAESEESSEAMNFRSGMTVKAGKDLIGE